MRDRIADRYARFYAPMALANLMLVAFPPVDDVDRDDVHLHFGSLFAMAGRANGELAVYALALLAALVTFLVAASFRARTTLLPVLIVALAAVLVLVLATRPGSGRIEAPLSSAGVAWLLLGIATMAIGIVHVVHLRRTPWPPPIRDG